MKIGLGLYRHQLTNDNFQFAYQAGATHLVAHLVDYDALKPNATPEARLHAGSGLWSEDELIGLKRVVNDHGLEFAAIENFDPRVWYDVLLDGPRRAQQIEDVKTLIARVGSIGVPIIGYNFSLANVWGHVNGPWARGDAISAAFRGPHPVEESLVPNGEVWNVRYSDRPHAGTIGEVSEEEMWRRLEAFLVEVVPVAEDAGVRLAMHPADPPVPVLRGTGRLVYHPDAFQRLLDLVPSTSNSIEFCQGTVAEMPNSDVYEAIDRYSRSGNIAYVHLRNVKGKAPDYREVFLDEGDVNMIRAVEIYLRNGFNGVVIPDHTPHMTCAAPWHAGMAYALGHIRAIVTALGGSLN